MSTITKNYNVPKPEKYYIPEFLSSLSKQNLLTDAQEQAFRNTEIIDTIVKDFFKNPNKNISFGFLNATIKNISEVNKSKEKLLKEMKKYKEQKTGFLYSFFENLKKAFSFGKYETKNKKLKNKVDSKVLELKEKLISSVADSSMYFFIKNIETNNKKECITEKDLIKANYGNSEEIDNILKIKKNYDSNEEIEDKQKLKKDEEYNEIINMEYGGLNINNEINQDSSKFIKKINLIKEGMNEESQKFVINEEDEISDIIYAQINEEDEISDIIYAQINEEDVNNSNAKIDYDLDPEIDD